MADFDKVVRGTIVTEDGATEGGYVAIQDGKIARIGQGPAPAVPAARESEDFGNAFILPGAIDPQVHSRSQGKEEDFLWSTRAAAAGGVTTIIDMPYDQGVLIATPELLREKAAEASEQARVDFALYGTINPRDGVGQIAALAEAGATAFKFSTFETHPERFPRITTPMLRDAFAEVAKTGLAASVHNENQEVIDAAMKAVQAAGITDYRAHTASRPPISETLAIAEVYEIAQETGCSGHIVHCSLGRGYEMAESYRAQGVDATIEACIHYLVCCEEDDVSRLVGKAKCNPPIRQRAEREALWKHLARGNISVISTDHVSWKLERKSSPNMLENSSGMPGLEVMGSLLIDGLVERGLPLSHAAKLLSGNAARLFRISHRKGQLAVGCDADIVVYAERPRLYDPAASGHNAVSWSPYEGRLIRHAPVATYLRGEMVFDGTEVLAEPGYGTWIKPVRAVAQ
ncbi:MAG: dihydroorotase [Tropicimonas sp.]|uniref:dihydroorotase n=1 Tax=Tropicimonas sp. TaxID=2067044 RepID=UPI003A87B0AE